MKYLILILVFLPYVHSYADTSQQQQSTPPPVIYDPFYIPPDPNLVPGDTEENDIYKANQHRYPDS